LKSLSIMADAERQFVDLIFRASAKYGNWDPEDPVAVGDYGRITQGYTSLACWRKKQGTFQKEGNIYKEGLAEKYNIPVPEERGVDSTEGISWITSNNAKEVDISAEILAQTPALVSCKAKSAFKFVSGRGAIIAMDNDTIYTIDSPGKFRRLLEEEKVKDRVLVSQVHRCSSYARFLTTEDGATVALGVSVADPVSNSAAVDAKWVRNSGVGNFKTKVNSTGERKFYPLFKLVTLSKSPTIATSLRILPASDEYVVTLTEGTIATSLRSLPDEYEPEERPLPNAIPPWEPVGESKPQGIFSVLPAIFR